LDAVINAQAYEKYAEGHGDEVETAHKGNGESQGPDETHEKGGQAGEDKPARTEADHQGDGHEEEGYQSCQSHSSIHHDEVFIIENNVPGRPDRHAVGLMKTEFVPDAINGLDGSLSS